MDQDQATEFIVQALRGGEHPEAIVQALCQRTGWPLAQVAPFVRRVADTHRTTPDDVVPNTARADAAPMAREQPVDVSVASSNVRETPVAALDEGKVQFVVKALGARRSHESIIHTLCEQTGQPWHKVQHFVRRVEIEHSDEISARTGRLLAVLGVLIMLAGILLIAFVAYTLLQGEVYGELIALLGVGIGMSLGGLAGTWRAWRAMRG